MRMWFCSSGFGPGPSIAGTAGRRTGRGSPATSIRPKKNARDGEHGDQGPGHQRVVEPAPELVDHGQQVAGEDQRPQQDRALERRPHGGDVEEERGPRRAVVVRRTATVKSRVTSARSMAKTATTAPTQHQPPYGGRVARGRDRRRRRATTAISPVRASRGRARCRHARGRSSRRPLPTATTRPARSPGSAPAASFSAVRAPGRGSPRRRSCRDGSGSRRCSKHVARGTALEHHRDLRPEQLGRVALV